MDGANIEIYDEVGEENIFIFGARVEELDALNRTGSYDPHAVYEANPELRRVLDTLKSGALKTSSGKQFEDLYDSLLGGGPGLTRADKYFVLHDFASYDEVFCKLLAAYADRDRWNRMSVLNTIRSGIFSSDRTIGEYSDLIWRLKAIE
jgi:starch phosphorylase